MIKLRILDFVNGLSQISVQARQINPKRGVIRVTWSISKLWGPWPVFGTGAARHFQFGVQSKL